MKKIFEEHSLRMLEKKHDENSFEIKEAQKRAKDSIEKAFVAKQRVQSLHADCVILRERIIFLEEREKEL